MGRVNEDKDILVADPWPVVCKGCGEVFMFDPSSSYYYECCSSKCARKWISEQPVEKTS